jgi:putative membrane protein
VLYLWIKAIHVIFVVAWFAGLFYLPRLFVYHCDVCSPSEDQRFQLMERRLYKFTVLNTVIAVSCGIGLVGLAPEWLLQHWLQLKFLLVLALLAFQWSAWRRIVSFREGRNRYSGRWYRWYNEIPTLLLFAIVMLVILKPRL